MKKQTIFVTNLNEVKENKNILYFYKDYEIMIYRVNNDINGNPLYKLYLRKDFNNINEKLKGIVYRCYIKKGYSLIQSYDLSTSLIRIFEQIEK